MRGEGGGSDHVFDIRITFHRQFNSSAFKASRRQESKIKLKCHPGWPKVKDDPTTHLHPAGAGWPSSNGRDGAAGRRMPLSPLKRSRCPRQQGRRWRRWQLTAGPGTTLPASGRSASLKKPRLSIMDGVGPKGRQPWQNGATPKWGGYLFYTLLFFKQSPVGRCRWVHQCIMFQKRLR